MAIFRPGDRAKIVRSRFPDLVGKEVTVISDFGLFEGCCEEGYKIEIDGVPFPYPFDFWIAPDGWIVPLTDPKEEAKRQVRELLDNALKAEEKSKQVVNSRDSIGAPDKVYFANERHV